MTGAKAIDVVPWDKADVAIYTASGQQIEKGLVHPLCPGLAVTMHQFGTFDVTHIATGKTIVKGFERCDSAILATVELSLCADWTQSAAELNAFLKSDGGQESAGIDGATSTTGGVTRPMTKFEMVQSLRSTWRGDEFPWEGDDAPGYKADELLQKLAARAASA